MVRSGRVQKPEWVEACHIEKTLKLYREGRLPKTIEKWMLVTPAKQLLRGCYGCSNFRVALILLVEATAAYWKIRYWDIRWRLGLVPKELKEDVLKDLEGFLPGGGDGRQ